MITGSFIMISEGEIKERRKKRETELRKMVYEEYENFKIYISFYELPEIKKITFMNMRGCDAAVSPIFSSELEIRINEKYLKAKCPMEYLKVILFHEFTHIWDRIVKYADLRAAKLTEYHAVQVAFAKNLNQKRIDKWDKFSENQFVSYNDKRVSAKEYLCRKQEPQIYLPMLLAVTAGLRVSEAIGLKYEDIDFLNKKLTVTRQLGRSLYPENSHIERPALSQEIQLKTARSHRQVELADFVLDEILLERQRYEKRKAEDPGFQNLGYICCQKDGRCYNRRFYTDAYNRILQQCEFPRLEWRKFRNTYATILSDYQVHIKTISQCLGHYSPDFTKKVYVFVKEPDVYDISHAIGEYVSTNRLLPVPRSWKETDVYLLPGDSVYREYFLNNFYSI